MIQPRFVVIPAAGVGSRLAPFTKAIAKEVMPLIDQPALGYLLQEVRAASMNHVVLINNIHKESLIHYMAYDSAVNQHDVSYSVVYQHEPSGLADAVALARPITGDASLAIALPDDVLPDATSSFLYMQQVAHLYGYDAVLAVQEVPSHRVSSYGVIAIKERLAPGIFCIQNLVEKPALHEAPSSFAIVGRYILPSIVYDYIDKVPRVAGKERQLTQALQAMVADGIKILAVVLSGIRYDIGTTDGWIKALIDQGAKDPHIRAYMQECLQQYGFDLPTTQRAYKQTMG